MKPHNAFWIGDKLADLLTLSIAELQDKYPGRSAKSLKRKKSHYKKLIREGKIQMPESLPEETEQRLTKTWEVAMRGQDGEWDVTTLHAYEHNRGQNDYAEVFTPAEPANITPTDKERATRIGQKILVFGDTQIGYRRVFDPETGDQALVPTHNEAAINLLNQINASERPEVIVNLSDTIDLAEFSRFDPDSDHFHRTLAPAFQRVHDMYAQLIADNPDVKIYETDSNHTVRPTKALLRKMPELYGFTLPNEKYPLMTYYRLANLGALGVNFISGYGAAEYVHGEEYGTPIIFKHGVHSSSSPGATVRKEAQQNPTTHVVRGHGHSYESMATTTRSGEYLYYIQLGTTCDTTGSVPSYHSSVDDMGVPTKHQENWQNQLLMVTDYMNGRYQFDIIDLQNGVAYYGGTEYRVEES